MLQNYLKIAYRNLLRNKLFSFINIFGLATGMACCLLIVLYVVDEFSYDRFHDKGNRIVRVIMEYSFGDESGETAHTGTKVAPAFSRDFPEVEQAVRVYDAKTIVKYQDKLFEEKAFFYADSTFFRIFSFPLLQGDPATALEGPNKVVLTASTARKYFGEKNPVGQTLRINDNQDYLVTGVMKDVPANSQIKFDFVASFASLAASRKEEWFSANYKTYLLLQDQEAIASLQAKIPSYMEEQMGEDMKGQGYLTYQLEPLTSVHLYSKYAGFEPNSDIRYIYIFSIIGLLILLIACTNYMNLTTARATGRAKEVGVRKVMGAVRGTLFWQFMGESVIITTAAMLLSVLLGELLMPYFNQLAGKQLMLALLNPWLLLGLLATGVLISFLAGSYPAIALSAYQPVKVLKGNLTAHGSGLWLRKGLIVFQFVISAFLIIATLVIQRQLYYVQNKKLGYNQEHVLVLPSDTKVMERLGTFKTELRQHPHIKQVTTAYETPTDIDGGYQLRKAGEDKGRLVKAIPVEKGFLQTLELELLAGTDFTFADEQAALLPEENEQKQSAMLLNESAVREMGWTPEEAVGQQVEEPRKGVVKGVVRDFHYSPLYEGIGPLVIFLEQLYGGVILVKISGEDLPGTLRHLETTWQALAPNRPFSYTFLDEEYANLYQAERRTGKIFGTFAFLAVMLACLGLFGLAAFMAQQRTKEIGIRKVLGASVASIVGLLSKDFVKLVLVAFAIAAPLAWYAMRRWLEDFTYRIELEWWVFAIVGGLVVLIAVITVSFQAVKAALADPVKSLRSE